jgi:hypothetical protein
MSRVAGGGGASRVLFNDGPVIWAAGVSFRAQSFTNRAQGDGRLSGGGSSVRDLEERFTLLICSLRPPGQIRGVVPSTIVV